MFDSSMRIVRTRSHRMRISASERCLHSSSCEIHLSGSFVLVGMMNALRRSSPELAGKLPEPKLRCSGLRLCGRDHLGRVRTLLQYLASWDPPKLFLGPFFVPFPGIDEAKSSNIPIMTRVRSCTILPTFVGYVLLDWI